MSLSFAAAVNIVVVVVDECIQDQIHSGQTHFAPIPIALVLAMP
jgi:hypothetical protein